MEAAPPVVDSRLSQLQEIPLPAAVPYIPATVGWIVVAVLLLIAAGVVCWLIVRHRRRNAYRREALEELALIESNLTQQSAQPGLTNVPALLKRTAIAASSRETVASLSGDEWLRFLDRTMNGDAFEKGAGRCLPRLAYALAPPTDMTPDEQQALIALSRRWIRTHRVHEVTPRAAPHADV